MSQITASTPLGEEIVIKVTLDIRHQGIHFLFPVESDFHIDCSIFVPDVMLRAFCSNVMTLPDEAPLLSFVFGHNAFSVTFSRQRGTTPDFEIVIRTINQDQPVTYQFKSHLFKLEFLCL